MALKYLLSPTFQVINTAGKPATGGYIEVYIHGTRDRYYCASDFDGTLHPFKIPLDSLGANIVLADDSQTYDVYEYNRYGSLIMSRYDVPTVRGKDSAYSGDVSDATSTLTKNEGDLSSMASGMSIKTILTSISNFFAAIKKVAFSASYNDLSDKPSIPAAQVNSDWNANSGVAQILNKPSLSAVATSGNYNDLSNKPSIPDDAGLVHKTGAETITGIKTFNNDVSPRQNGTSFSKQSKVFVCSIIKPYAEWSAEEKDNNHFRLWTIDITSVVSVASTHCNIVVKLMGSFYSTSGNGALQKEITFQVYNGNIVISKGDYTVAQSPCADEFAISGVFKSGSDYLVQVVNRNPTANNYPLRLEIDMFNKYNSAVLDAVTMTESITEGLPIWAVDVAQVTANGSPVLTEATAATVAKTGSYNDLNDRPLPCNIFGSYGPSVEQLTATDVSNGYKDFTYILKYGLYPGRNFTFWTNNALVFVSLNHLEGIVGQSSFPASTFTFEVYAGYESDPTKVLIRSVTKTDLTDTDDRGEPVQDTDPVWNCQLLGSRFLVICDRITVRVKWKSSSFGSTSNRIKPSFAVAVMNPSGMTEWPQE